MAGRRAEMPAHILKCHYVADQIKLLTKLSRLAHIPSRPCYCLGLK